MRCVGTLITWPYTSGGRSRRGSPKAGTTVFPFVITGGRNSDNGNIISIELYKEETCLYMKEGIKVVVVSSCDDVDNGLDNTCEVIRQETVLFSTPETDYIIYD